ncbi:MAG: DNA-binding protein [Actinobacteria bacterium HGW-Actinobacteria-4]|nr:MAG: DNA-binding protein [Actinobacteria bacterium HGW-Actinobacteria-4]
MAGAIKDMAWVSERTGIPINTLRYYRMRGEGGPPSFRLGGRRVMYAVEDVEAWIEKARETGVRA